MQILRSSQVQLGLMDIIEVSVTTRKSNLDAFEGKFSEKLLSIWLYALREKFYIC